MAYAISRWFISFPFAHKIAGGMGGRWALPAVWAMVAGLIAGCQDNEIRHYQAPKPDETRLLGAILPHGKQVWFFKLMGPAPEVEKHKAEFDELLASVRFPNPPDPPIIWNVPESWEQEPANPRQQHYAAFDLGASDFLLTLTVHQFEDRGDTPSVLANVNRWRGQLDLGEIEEPDLAECVTKRQLEAGPATIVDLNSRMKSPEIAVARPPRDGIQYDTPEGWKKKANLPPFAKAAFVTGDGAEVTISPFKGLAGGLAANINRLRKDQLGLPEVSEEQIRKDLQPIEVGGIAGNYVDLTGPEIPGREPQRILEAIVAQNDRTWFFKMRGTASVVGNQKAAFETFLKSVRFDAGAGANDGKN